MAKGHPADRFSQYREGHRTHNGARLASRLLPPVVGCPTRHLQILATPASSLAMGGAGRANFSTKLSGGGEIRTRGPLRVAGFQDRWFQPLTHPSVPSGVRSFEFLVLSGEDQEGGRGSWECGGLSYKLSYCGFP